jgi:hypothetical protein
MIRLEETTIIEAPIERCFVLSLSVEVHLLSNVHSGEQALAVGGVTSGLVCLSEEVTWRAKHFGIWQNLAEHGGKRGKKRAVIAVARKLAVLLHRLWVSGEVYVPARPSGRATLPAVA